MQQVDESLPVVTVVIPCHNHEKWIQGAMKSVLGQDYPHTNLRLLVVDDGSTDTSCDMALSLLEARGKDVMDPNGVRSSCGMYEDIPTIISRRPQAGGPSVARNLGIAIGADGTDIFGFLDSDDTYEPTKISQSVRVFLQSPLIGVVYSDYTTVDENGVLHREFKEPFSRERLLKDCIVNCDSLVLKRAFEECGLFDEEMRVCEDYDLWIRISELFVISHIPQSLVNLRVGSHSSTANVKPEIWQQNWRRISQKLQQRLQTYGHRQT